MLRVSNLTQKIIFDFNNAIADLEALNNFFAETLKILKSKKIDFEEKYVKAFSLSKILDEIYSKDDENRKEYIDTVQEQSVFQDIKVKDIINISLSENGTIQYSMKPKYRKKEFDPSTARMKMKSILNQETIFIRSILSNAIIIFEQFFSSQYETLVLQQPKKYFEDKKISICELFDKDIRKIVSYTIDKEVEANMFDSLKTLDKIKEKSKIDVDRLIPIRKEFEEIYYRRNVYVHAEGRANEIYLEKVDSKYTQKIKTGEKLICDDLYLENVILTVYKIICSLHFELLRISNASPDDYDSLSSLGFEALKNRKYNLAEYIYGILRREKSFEYRDKAMYEVNYINALKLQGENVKNLIDSFDVSIATDDFKIAKDCILDNHESVYNMLMATYPKSFCAVAIREWPIFIKFRETQYYKDFINMHKDDFEIFLFEDEKNKEDELNNQSNDNNE